MKSITIGDIADIYSGYAFKSKDLNDDPSGIPVIKIGNLVGAEVDYSTSQYYSDNNISNIQDKYYLQDKDILIAMTGQGSVGRVSQLRKKNPNDILLLNQRVGKIVVDPQKADQDFVFFLLSSNYYQDYLFSAGYGSGQPNLSPDTIKNVIIPQIDLQQQKKISAVLSRINDKIYNNKAINQNLLQQGLALFSSWFVDRAPFNKDETENWESISVYDLADFINGAAFKKDEYAESGLPIIKIAELKNGITDSTQYCCVTKDSKYYIEDQDILFFLVG